MFDLSEKRIFVAGHRGMVGAALVRRLEREPCQILTRSRAELDLCDQRAVSDFMAEARPDAVILAAAKVGGIFANDRYPADFIRDNLAIELNVIDAAFRIGVQKLLFLGSSCIYPKLAPQPITEEALLTGPLEPTNEWYAVAKIAGVKLCQAYRKQHGADFIAAMPTNLYGPLDNFDLETSHVIPALLRKAHEAKVANASSFVVWGSGEPRREFLHVDDCADALTHLLKVYSGPVPVNVGAGVDFSIAEIARLVAETVGFSGNIEFDPSKPDGAPRKLLCTAFAERLGWRAKIGLKEGLADAYSWFRAHGA